MTVARPGLNVAGIDTHKDSLHIGIISPVGIPIIDHEFACTADGYSAAVTFITDHGPVGLVGVEGTSSYGTGITRRLQTAGYTVVEVYGGRPSSRRNNGKSDPLDAYEAARAALADDGTSTPKDERTNILRGLHLAARSAVKARTTAINQMRAILISAPEAIREKYRHLDSTHLVTALAVCRPATQNDLIAITTLTTLRTLAKRARFLTDQHDDLTAQVWDLAREMNPALCAAFGVGPDVAAQLMITAGANPNRLSSEAAFAALCGAIPIPVSSGKTNRHRLSRGGDRQGNSALHTIALSRMRYHPKTKAYLARQLAAGRTKKDILRMLKRAIAREMFKLLTRQIELEDFSDLRPARQAAGLPLTVVAAAFGTSETEISRLERNLKRDDHLAHKYRQWLADHHPANAA